MRRFIPVFLLLIGLNGSVFAQSVEKILSEFDKALAIPTIQGAFRVKLIAKNGDTREVEARAYQKLVGENQNNRLFVFDFPPTVRGTSILLHSFFDDRENNMWIYLPTIRRVKRIALESSGGGYFMGSDFTYRDLINNDSSDLDFEKLEDRVVDGKECYVLKAWGKNLSIRQEMGYSHIISFYNKENFVLFRREYYDFNDELLKVYDVKEFFVQEPYYYPTEVSMTNVQTGHRSVLEVTEISTEDIPDRFFTVRYLRNN